MGRDSQRHPTRQRFGTDLVRNLHQRHGRWGLMSQNVRYYTSVQQTLPQLFTSMVRPHLEYGNVIWSPRYQRDKLEIEKIQRRATKLIPKLREVPYKERLVALRLPSLHYRRGRGDMIQVLYILKGIDQIDPGRFFMVSDQAITRGHSLKLLKQRCGSLVKESLPIGMRTQHM